ncbi:[citrate (pro-3S)-lyase] ligase [Lactobacillus psittaci]|uniref:[Citrate [pro-3S]-lyase] ligase n=1 Tax=Lactobacillus psittaci DSM 15354 TaxID=1122152 RepID=A0A0R1S596_9LACO|nr:[citrate (pro-3S)-lyase] ligase [Lactobacillus psittaci]KRL63678.1 [citrate (pro-3S)-lyase] ligase [Lactobacillus psittaci DSM 15354]
MDKVVDLYLSDPATKKRWINFLEKLDLHNFSEREVDVIDHTLGLIDEEGNLVGTGSVAGNVLKYIAVCNKDSEPGQRFNKIVTALSQYLFTQQIFHMFVFTKVKYADSFKHLGFNELARTDEAAFLENGSPDVNDYLNGLPKIENQSEKRVAGIVMNANPFTFGHRYLVQKASQENDLVYVFVVATDMSLFNSKERFELVKKGCAEFENVYVVSGDSYMVSAATFPAYFLKSADTLIENQTTIDARVFKNVIAPGLSIKHRYVGTEPFSHATSIYNDSLKRELEPEINLHLIPRLQKGNTTVTATKVRQLIKTDDLAAIEDLVPASTAEFIKANKEELQKRIREGMKIDGN